MRYVAAYLLAVLGGNNNPSEADIKKILSSVGIDADSEQLKKVVGELSGKNLEEVIAEGRAKLASMPAAGAVGAAPASGAGPSAKAAEAPKAEEKKEEPKKEESESEDEDMGFGLFD